MSPGERSKANEKARHAGQDNNYLGLNIKHPCLAVVIIEGGLIHPG